MNETFHSDVQIDGQSHKWTDQQTDGQKDGQLNKQGVTLRTHRRKDMTDKRRDRRTDRWT